MLQKSNSTSTESLYSVHPSVAYAQAIINNLPDKTGKSIDEWVRLVEESGPVGEKERRAWLKKEFKLGGTTAALIAQRAEGGIDEENDEEAYLKAAPRYVEAMFSGAKAGLRPIHDELIRLARSLGDDVKICPCKTMVPLYRNHVFAQVKPATRTRIDLGLALKSCPRPLSERLIDTGGLARGDRITHRFALTSVEDIDDEVKEWLRIAYDLDA